MYFKMRYHAGLRLALLRDNRFRRLPAGNCRGTSGHEGEKDVDQKRQERREEIDAFLTESFDSILRIEEKTLDHSLMKGLTIKEIHTIVAIGYDEVNPMNVIASRLNVTLATLTVAVNRLVDKGFVVRERDEIDRRKINISLTKEGRKVFRVHKLFHKQMIDAAIEGLSDEEIDVLARSLSQLSAYFESRM